MPTRLRFDQRPRPCHCGKQFRVTDYPKGYFEFKRDVAQGSGVNTCPECETDIIRDAIKNLLKTTEPTLGTEKSKIEDSIIMQQQDVFLLLTNKPCSERHKRNIQKVYQ